MKTETEAKIRELSKIFAENVTIMAEGRFFELNENEQKAMQDRSARGYELTEELSNELGIEEEYIDCHKHILEYARINGSDAAEEMAAVMPFYLKAMEEIQAATPEGACALPEVMDDAFKTAREACGIPQPEI